MQQVYPRKDEGRPQGVEATNADGMLKSQTVTTMMALLAIDHVHGARQRTKAIRIERFCVGGAMMKLRYRAAMSAVFSLGFVPSAIATETITYTYDAKGRLVKVVRTGTVNNNVTTEYEHDKADNRKKVKTTNSPNAPP